MHLCCYRNSNVSTFVYYIIIHTYAHMHFNFYFNAVRYSVGNDGIMFLMGDFNGSPDTGSYNLLTEASFISAHSRVHGLEPQVTHRDHRGNEFTADYIFYKCV